MSLYSQYAAGIKNSTSGTYNLLVSGGTDYKQSSGIYLGNATVMGASTHIYQDISSNAYIDFQSNATNSFSMRYLSNATTFSNMLSLMNDTQSNSSIHAANINGRMAASQFVSTGDVRAPSQTGLYIYQNTTNGAMFGVAGTGGFTFANYNSNGTLNNTALVLNPNGSVLTPYYSQTMYGADNEAGAVCTLDASGNILRGWNMNYRLRVNEQNSNTIYNVLNAALPNTINNIITRMNALSVYSSNLPPLAPVSSIPITTISTVTPLGNQQKWSSIAGSTSGKYQLVCTSGASGVLCISSDFGVTWTQVLTSAAWSSVSSDSTGQYMVACVNGGNVYQSNDYGVTWTSVSSLGTSTWTSVSMSPTATSIYAIGANTYMYSTSTGVWTIQGTVLISAPSVSSNGVYLVGFSSTGLIISSNGGTSWTATSVTASATPTNTYSAISSTGQFMLCTMNGVGYLSTDAGTTWKLLGINNSFVGGYAVAMSSTGQVMATCNSTSILSGQIYYSVDYGANWYVSTLGVANWTSISVILGSTVLPSANLMQAVASPSVANITSTNYNSTQLSIVTASVPSIPTPTPVPLASATLVMYGEWVQVQWTSAKVLGSYQLLPRYGVTASVFQAFSLLGSNDGSTWYFIQSSTSPLVWATNAPNTFYVTPMQAYTYFRLVVSRANSPAEIGGWYLYDVSGNPFALSSATISGGNNQYLQQSGTTVATVSWSWSNAVQSSTTKPFAYILTPTNYATTYLGFLQPTEYPSSNNGLVTTSAPTTSYSLLTGVSNTVAVNGEWVQILFATSVAATSVSLYPKSNGTNVFQSFTLVGLNGSTWTYLMSASNLIWTVNEPLTFSIPNVTMYSSYRIIVTQATTSTWDLGGCIFSSASGVVLPGSYTYSGASGSVVMSGATTMATLSWSWATMDGAPTNTGSILVTPLASWVGVAASSEYLSSNNGIANSSAPLVSYTNAPLPLISQTVYGEWIQIQLPNPVVITSIQLAPYASNTMFQSFYVLGSNDGTTWNYLMNNTNTVLWSTGVPLAFTVMTMAAYTYYRLVVTQGPSPFNLSGFMLYGSSGAVLSTVSSYTITGANNHILQASGVTKATMTWSWSNTYTQSTSQSVERIMTSNGYASSPAYLGCTNAAEYPAAQNGFATTSSPLTTYNYVVPSATA